MGDHRRPQGKIFFARSKEKLASSTGDLKVCSRLGGIVVVSEKLVRTFGGNNLPTSVVFYKVVVYYGRREHLGPC